MSEGRGLALASAGHDRGTLYLVLEDSAAGVLLADGRLRRLHRPKRKNRKHVIFLPDSAWSAVSGKLPQPLSDAAVRRALAGVRAQQGQ